MMSKREAYAQQLRQPMLERSKAVRWELQQSKKKLREEERRLMQAAIAKKVSVERGLT